MIELMPNAVALDAAAASTIAAVLRDVAAVDGNHPAELEMIHEFEAGLSASGEHVDLDALSTPELRSTLVRTMVRLGLADNHISDAEHARILEWTRKVGLDEDDLAAEIVGVARGLLGQFRGVFHFRDQVLSMGREMGLTDDQIREVIDG